MGINDERVYPTLNILKPYNPKLQDPGAGEVHLETVLKDLRERFARCELRVSPPLTAFRESVFAEAEAPEPGAKPAKVEPAPLLLLAPLSSSGVLPRRSYLHMLSAGLCRLCNACPVQCVVAADASRGFLGAACTV